MFEKNFSTYYRESIQLLKIFILGIIILTCFRTAHLLSYGTFSELTGFKLDLIQAYWAGLAFDGTVLAHSFLFVFIINLLILCPPHKTEKKAGMIRKVSYWYYLFTLIVLIAVQVADFFYYMFFQSHINKLVFGILNEPKAVLTSVWTDYPITAIAAFFIGMSFILAYVVRKIHLVEHEKCTPCNAYRKLLVVILMLLYVVALRGSIGRHPISKHVDSYISPNIFLNDLTLNGLFSFKEAIMERMNSKTALNIPAILRQSSFLSYYNSRTMYDKELRAYIDNIPDLKELPLLKTPANSFLEKNPPNVVFFLMESMSNYYLDFHSPSLNLLGSLEGQLEDCIVFRNFLPYGPSTAQSLMGLMVNDPNITFMKAQEALPDGSLLSSVAFPFLKAGYQTSFTTGQGLEWIRLDEFVPRQYFQSVEGRDKIFADVEGAEGSEWEVFDEFMFEYILRKLKNSKDTPQFIFSMSVSNHTPFDLPSGYKPFPVEIPSSLANKIKVKKALAVKNFTGYQYANHQLGVFLEKLRSSPLGENTIVVATGDHNILQLFQFSYMELLHKLSVPLIMYIPDKYLPAGEIDNSLFASHKDIFPTIMNLSLSGASYFKTGNNLFDTTSSPSDYFAVFDNRVAMNRDGVILLQERPLFYRWQITDKKHVEQTSLMKKPELKELLKNSTAYILRMNAFFQTDLVESHLSKVNY